MRTGAVGALLISAAAFANPNLDKGRALVAELKYAEALKALQAAEAAPGNRRAELLEIYELEGVVLGSLNKSEPARDAFTRLLTLEPNRKLGGKLAPRVMTPFYEAKGQVHEMGALRLDHGSGRAADQVNALGFSLKDPVGVARHLLVHVSEEGRPWRIVKQAASAQMMVSVSGAQVSWYAELLGEHEAELVEVFTAAAPAVEQAVAPLREPAPLAVAAPPPPPPPPPVPAPTLAPAPAAAPEPAAVAPIEPPKPVFKSRLRPLAVTLGVLAFPVSALGGVFELAAQSQLAQWNSAMRARDGTITGLTRAQAIGLDTQTRTWRKDETVTLVIAGLLGLSSSIVWWLGSIFPVEVRE